MLTQRQASFVWEYPIDYNATKAAIRAGYSPISAHISGHRNLQNPQVMEKLKDKLREDQWRPTNIREFAIEHLTQIVEKDDAPINMKLKACVELHKIALAMEKILIQKDKQNQNIWERNEKMDQQELSYNYREMIAKAEYEKEQEEEEKELAMLAKEMEEIEAYNREYEKASPETETQSVAEQIPIRDSQISNPDARFPIPDSQIPNPESKSTYDWKTRMKELTDPEWWEAETEKWEKLGDNVYKLKPGQEPDDLED